MTAASCQESKDALAEVSDLDRAVFTKYGPRRLDRIVHLVGVRPGTLGWRCTERGCASEIGKL